jgi:glutathione S-transferase
MPAGKKLLPEDDALRREALELEDHFDKKLGPATRRWVYSWALHDRPLLVQAMSADLPPIEAAAVRMLRPLIVAGLTRGLGLSDEAAERSQARIAELLEEMGRRLSDGRRYLVGDRFGLADLTFAALAAPAVVPPEYGAAMPSPGELPEPMRRTVEVFRNTPAGAFALRIYRDHRR